MKIKSKYLIALTILAGLAIAVKIQLDNKDRKSLGKLTEARIVRIRTVPHAVISKSIFEYQFEVNDSVFKGEFRSRDHDQLGVDDRILILYNPKQPKEDILYSN